MRPGTCCTATALLRGWTLTDVSFYTTELPEYAAVELARGLNPGALHVTAALTYTLLILLAAFLARGQARGREGWARALIAAGVMVAPQLGDGVHVLLAQPDHVGTQVLILGTFLVLERAPRRWYTPVAVWALLTVAIVADKITIVDAVVPLAELVMSLRHLCPLALESSFPRTHFLTANHPDSKTQGFSTRAIHAGQEPEPATGAVNVPIYASSTYVQEEIGKHKGYEYSRVSNPTPRPAGDQPRRARRRSRRQSFASGMAAINAVTSMLKAGDHIVAGHNLYGGTPRLFNRCWSTLG